jgi:hypothetical protein
LFKKILPVTECLEDIEVLPAKTVWENKILPANTIQLPMTDKSIKEDDKTNKTGKPINRFNKWVMPQQPQAYIKCSCYDFF